MINIFNDFHQHFLIELLNGEVEFINRLKEKDFTEMLAFHFKNPPEKIEFLTKISGLHFDDAWSHCDYLKTGEFNIPFISFDDLIINKLSTGRLKDLADVEELQKIHPRGSA